MRKFLFFTFILVILSAFLACGDDASEETNQEPVEDVKVVEFVPPEPRKNFYEVEPEDDPCPNQPATIDPKAVRPLITYATPENFDKEVLESNYPVVVQFYAKWCYPCKLITPYVKDLAFLYPKIKFVKYDIDQDKPYLPGCVCDVYEVFSIPAFAFFYGGNEYTDYKFTGFKPDKLVLWVDLFFEEAKKQAERDRNACIVHL